MTRLLLTRSAQAHGPVSYTVRHPAPWGTRGRALSNARTHTFWPADWYARANPDVDPCGDAQGDEDPEMHAKTPAYLLACRDTDWNAQWGADWRARWLAARPPLWRKSFLMACIGLCFCLGLCLALCVLLMVPPAHADDDPDNPPRSVWCSIGDNSSQRLFISTPSRLPRTSRMAVYTYGGRFARTVNMRFGMHVGIEGTYCHAFPTPRRAAMAHAALIARMADQNFKIVSVGIF